MKAKILNIRDNFSSKVLPKIEAGIKNNETDPELKAFFDFLGDIREIIVSACKKTLNSLNYFKIYQNFCLNVFGNSIKNP